MPRTRGFQITAVQNLDRLMIKSMLTMAERHLQARWVETAVMPSVIFADADTPAGADALSLAKTRGQMAVAISARSGVQWRYAFKRPMQSRDLLALLNQIDAELCASAELHESRPKDVNTARASLDLSEQALLRKAGNLFDYLVRPGPRAIVDVRFAPGKTVIFNHLDGDYVSAMMPAQLVQMASASVQETAHGAGQASSEWNIARRVLPVRPIEELAWQVVISHSKGQLLDSVGNQPHSLARLPRLSAGQLSPAQLSMAKMLMRRPMDVKTLASSCGVPLVQAVDVCNALQACGLLTAPQAALRPTAALLGQVALFR